MVVNAFPGGGVFLKRLITGFKGKSTYEWALWLMNICRSDRCCSSLSPNIYVLLTTRSGKKIAGFSIGDLTQTMEPRWRKYRGFFNMPAGEKEVVLMMQDNAMGGCGNDFALDDISIRECVPQQPVVTTKSKNAAPGSVKQKLPATKQATPKDPGKTSTVKKKEHVISTSKKDSSSVITFLPIQKPATHLPTPPILRTRENPIVKQLEIPGGEIRIDLYDNGEIDGDTVSVYHNNELLISKARLSQKPVTLRMSIDNEHPHHELVMVANNLGSIPPNTSLMIITTRDKRYQVFISSSEQKNAKVVLDLKK
jgi:hypothetical protein